MDGKTGQPIYKNSTKDSLGSYADSVTVSMEGYGNDLFLTWLVYCDGFEANPSKFQFLTGTTVKQEYTADICRLRFNTSTVANLFALNEFNQPPGWEVVSTGT